MARNLLLTALVLISLTFLIFKVELPKEERERKSGLFLKGTQGDEIKNITVTKGKTHFTLTNPDPKKKESEVESDNVDDWRIEGVPGKIDEGATTGLVRTLIDLKLGEPLPKEDVDADLSVYGLKEPSVALSIDTLEGKQEIQLGALNSYLSKRFARIPSGEIYMIPDSLFSSASKERDDFRDRNPVKFDSTEVLQLGMQGDGKSWSVKRGDNGNWSIEHPITAKADGSKISEMLRKIRSLRVKSFIDDGGTRLQEYGLSTPEVRLSLQLEKDKKLSLSLSSRKDGEGAMYMALNDSPTVFEIEGNVINAFAQSSDQLRERKLFTFDPYVISSFELTQGGVGDIKGTKERENWKVNDKAGDPHFIEEYLKGVSELEAKEFPSKDEQISFDKPVLTLVVKGENRSQTLIVGAPVERHGTTLHPAMNKEGGDIFFILEQDYKKLVRKEEVLRKVEEKKG